VNPDIPAKDTDGDGEDDATDVIDDRVKDSMESDISAGVEKLGDVYGKAFGSEGSGEGAGGLGMGPSGLAIPFYFATGGLVPDYYFNPDPSANPFGQAVLSSGWGVHIRPFLRTIFAWLWVITFIHSLIKLLPQGL
jgi:hypothetical protein